MWNKSLFSIAFLLSSPLFLASCSSEQAEYSVENGAISEIEKPFTSHVASPVDFEFDGELKTSNIANTRTQVKAQLLFTVGQLNGERSVARLERLTLTNIRTSAAEGGLYRLTYHAKLPVAWGSKTSIPSSYQLVLPRRVDTSGQATFTQRYGSLCNDGDSSAVNAGNYWYHYRPRNCPFSEVDITRTTVTVRPSAQDAIARYPEYHKVWEDGVLVVLAVFGKYAEGATLESDAGINAYNTFVNRVRQTFPNGTLTSLDRTGLVERSYDYPQGNLKIVALLVDDVRSAPAAFTKRYGEVSTSADLILYNGHAGLGGNVRALSQKGQFSPGKYQIFFFNGCDSFAYIDETLAKTRATLNPQDASGTRYMDTVSNAMPAYFHNLAEEATIFIRTLADEAQPKSYAEMFRLISSVQQASNPSLPDQVVVAVGEEDNLFHSSFDPQIGWWGANWADAVQYKQTLSYQTGPLSPGKYVITLAPKVTVAGGDADLRVRVGAAPTITPTYRCKSLYKNSNERCVVTLTAPSTIFLAVTGDVQGTSNFELRAFEDPTAR